MRMHSSEPTRALPVKRTLGGIARLAQPLRICVTGAECTGKTSLALELARHYAAPIVREYCRDYFAEKLARGDASVHTADIVRVAAEQARREDQAALWTGPLIVSDTDVFTLTVWSPLYLHERRPEIDALAESRRTEGMGPDLYLLCTPDFPFVPDEVRTSREMRDRMHPIYRERLDEAGVRWVEVGGTQRKRLSDSIAAVEQLFAELPQGRAEARGREHGGA